MLPSFRIYVKKNFVYGLKKSFTHPSAENQSSKGGRSVVLGSLAPLAVVGQRSLVMGRTALPALLAVAVLSGGGDGVYAFAPSIPGLSRFSSSATQPQAARSTASFSLGRWLPQSRIMQPRDTGVTSVSAALKNTNSIGTSVPTNNFVEGEDFVRDGRGLAVGDLVMINRSDGRSDIPAQREAYAWAPLPAPSIVGR